MHFVATARPVQFSLAKSGVRSGKDAEDRQTREVDILYSLRSPCMLPFTSAVHNQANMPANRRDLTSDLNQIWRHHFADTPRVNDVYIDYCYPWKSRLGLIRL